MRLIVGVDGSEDAMTALEAVTSRARETGDEVTVAVYTHNDSTAAVQHTVREQLLAADFDASVMTLEDDPAGQLVDIAETEGYDRIVLSGGHRSPLGKIQLDSVLEFVLLNAHTTVTLIR